MAGLGSEVKRQNAEAIAYLHDQERQGLQKCIGQLPWDERPLVAELARQVGVELGQLDGVLIFDPSAFKKQGTESVGVARQWCGRLGKVDNCQVGVYWGDASREDHALVDVRLYLPEDWAKDPARREKCGVPRPIRFRTRHQLALERCAHGPKGPMIVQGVKTRVRAKTDRRRTGPEETLVIFREPQADGTRKHNDYLSNAPPETPLAEFARVAKAEHRIEECLERAKREAGMGQYQVHNGIGRHHPQTLSVLAVWFLTLEQRRGKNTPRP